MKNPAYFGQAFSNSGALLIGENGALFPTTWGNTWFVDPVNGSNAMDGKSPLSAFASIQKAVNSAAARDLIMLAPGGYDETVTIPVRLNNLILMGTMGRGSSYIEPSTAGAEGMQVVADDVTLYNLGVAGDDTASYALNLHACARFRAYNCKFEGVTGPQILLDGTDDAQVADALFEGCEIAWGTLGFVFDNSTYGYPTQIFVRNCNFHDITTNMFGIASGGLVKGLEVTGCLFDNAEDGTAPTDYILLSDNGNTGVFAGNFFATATNATGVLTIGTGLKWSVNGTEAGWSAARPS